MDAFSSTFIGWAKPRALSACTVLSYLTLLYTPCYNVTLPYMRRSEVGNPYSPWTLSHYFVGQPSTTSQLTRWKNQWLYNWRRRIIQIILPHGRENKVFETEWRTNETAPGYTGPTRRLMCHSPRLCTPPYGDHDSHDDMVVIYFIFSNVTWILFFSINDVALE